MENPLKIEWTPLWEELVELLAMTRDELEEHIRKEQEEEQQWK